MYIVLDSNICERLCTYMYGVASLTYSHAVNKYLASYLQKRVSFLVWVLKIVIFADFKLIYSVDDGCKLFLFDSIFIIVPCLGFAVNYCTVELHLFYCSHSKVQCIA